MPSRIATRPIEEREAYFVNVYVKQGASKDKIPACEKRAHLKPGSGKKILARKSVKEDIARRLQPIEIEQIRQQTITDSVEAARAQFERQLSATLDHIKLHKIDFEVLQGRLMQGVIGLDIHRNPSELLDYIKTAMVVHGSIQSGNTKRISPLEESKENPAASVYTALFNRTSPSLTPPEKPSESEANEQDGTVSDLYPGQPTPPPVKLTPDALPPIGESLEEAPAKKPSNPDVITVEVG